MAMSADRDGRAGGGVRARGLTHPGLRSPGTPSWSSSRWSSSTRSSSSSPTRSRPSRTPPRIPLSRYPDPFDTDGLRCGIFDSTDFPLLAGQLGRWSRCWSPSAGSSSTRWPATRWPGCASAAAAALFAAVIAVMAVPGVVLLIPKFLVLNQLGIYNSYTGLILPLIADAAGVFIMKQFFESIPSERGGGGPDRRRGRLPHLLVGGAADGPAGADHADHPVLPGLLERVPAHPRGGAEPGAVHRCPAAWPTWSAARSARAPSTRSSWAPRCWPPSRSRSSS